MTHNNFDNAVPTLLYFNNRCNTPNWRIDHSKIDFIDLTYVTRGQAIYTIDNQKILAEEGSVICIPKNSTRSAKSANPIQFECFATNFVMHNVLTSRQSFALQNFATPLGKGATPPSQANNLIGGVIISGEDIKDANEEIVVPLPVLSQIGTQNDIVSYYRRLNENWLSRTPGYNMRARAEFMLILQRLLAILVYDVDTYQFDPRVKQAIRYITDNYAEPLTISVVAEAVSLNPVYFGALFKKETHVTFRDYLNTIRLNQAEEMLRTRKLNVTEVAQNCGFTDVFYFSRLFKKHKGIPPSAVKA